MTTPEIIAPVDGQTESWAQLAPFGEYSYTRPGDDPAKPSGVQRLDAQAFESLLGAFDGEVLIDREHYSIHTGDTTAMGWITRLETRGDGSNPEDGLYALVRWTDIGLDHIRNRRLRWLSPVWDVGADNRPVSLDTAALSNRTRFRKITRPVANKEDRGQATQKPDTPEGGKDNTMDKSILEMLGLGPDATVEDAKAKLQGLIDSLAASNKECGELKKDALNTEAEKAAEENADKIENKEEFVRLYVENKDTALAMLKCVKAAPKTVCNKADAKAPSFVAGGGTKVLNKLDEYNGMPEGSAKDRFLTENKDELLSLQREAQKKS